ncbi:mycothiol synthase [Auritidibacter sp. NML130574]|nr:mycothiol synthase [Auritidibacter sp. NML130574]
MSSTVKRPLTSRARPTLKTITRTVTTPGTAHRATSLVISTARERPAPASKVPKAAYIKRTFSFCHGLGLSPGFRVSANFGLQADTGTVEAMNSLQVRDHDLNSQELSYLQALAALGLRADNNEPFSDQTWVEIRSGRAVVFTADSTSHPGWAVAAALVGQGNAENPYLVEMVVHPQERERGLGCAVADKIASYLQQNAPADALVTAWSHGNHEAANILAQRYGLAPVRELWRMGLIGSEGSHWPDHPPQGYRFRTFVPDQDERAWLEVNAAAFVDHPEQGKMTLQDLQSRMKQDWFSADGFFVAEQEDTGDMAGFHWTKVVPGAESGEVYAVGVSPEAQGSGLGRALTARGMNYLVENGLTHLVLYVDADNTPATKLYDSLGFSVENVDVMFSSTTSRHHVQENDS